MRLSKSTSDGLLVPPIRSHGIDVHLEGKQGLFPDGIDVLRKADFYSVGTRRNAFLIAAPQVGE